jgi:hypothetical protein
MADTLRAFYVYALFRETGEPFYIGKGKNGRWLQHELLAKRGRSHKDNIICKMLAAGIAVPKLKLEENMTNDEACRLEIDLIALLGRHPNGPLTNLTRGGDGVIDLPPEIKEKHRRNTSAGQMGHRLSEETKKKIATAHLGRINGPARQSTKDLHKIQMMEQWKNNPELRSAFTRKGAVLSDETKARMRASALGRVISAETRIKIGLAQKGKKRGPPSDETRLKIAAAQKGRQFTPEHKLKLSISRRAVVAREAMEMSNG